MACVQIVVAGWRMVVECLNEEKDLATAADAAAAQGAGTAEMRERENVLRGELQKLDERQTRNRNEAYTLFSLYMVFQGVVVTAVFAAPSRHLCSLWWIPFTLSLIATVAIAWILVERMVDIARTASAFQFVLLKQRHLSRMQLQQEVAPQQPRLLGVAFDVEQGGEESEELFASPFVPPTSMFGIAWTDFVRSYVWGILLLSFLFSAIVLAACKLILCK